MARLAIFIDGGYVDQVSRRQVPGLSIDLQKLVDRVCADVRSASHEPIDLLRSFYYTCPPFQGNPPSPQERERTANFGKFLYALERLPRFEPRLGRLQPSGATFIQKQVDLLLGLDIALLSGRQQITHAALVAGDGDLVPAIVATKREGVAAWLFHGPRQSLDNGERTYSEELWQQADERVTMDAAFWQSVTR